MTKKQGVGVYRAEKREEYDMAFFGLLKAFELLTREQIEGLYKLLKEDHILLYEALGDVIELEKIIR